VDVALSVRVRERVIVAGARDEEDAVFHLHSAVGEGEDARGWGGLAPGVARTIGDHEAREVVLHPGDHRDALAEVVQDLRLADVEELPLGSGLLARVLFQDGEPAEGALVGHGAS
jgi:hypothetical protein